MGLIGGLNGGLQGTLTGLTKSADHPSRGKFPKNQRFLDLKAKYRDNATRTLK